MGGAVQPAAVVSRARERAFFGHPRGLSTLFFVEMWERFSYYGMAAILVLYLTADATAGGAGLSVPEGAATYALYTALIYVVSLPGGWLADRVLGAKRAVLFGGATIAAGHFTMAFGGSRGVYAGLAIIIVGTGLLKPNTTSMVGDLYEEADLRRDSGFSLYYMAINLGAFIAPLITGYLAQAIGWHAGFAAAGVGMAIGLTHYALDWHGLGDVGALPRRPLPADERRRDTLRATVGLVAALVVLAVLLGALRLPLQTLQQWVNWTLVVLPLAYFVYMLRQPGRPAVERHRLTAMFVLFLATALWFAVVSQAGSTLNVFAEDDTQRAMWGFTIPAPWFQSINPVAILLFAPPLAWLWTHLGTRQPPTPVKFAVALFLVAGSMAMMVVASRYAPLSGDAAVLVSPLWLFGVFIVQTIGELLISPIGLSVATRLSPPSQTSQLMGVWFLGLAVGAALSGELAALYGMVGVSAYYGLLCLLMVATGGAIAVLTPWLLREMEGVR
jgi:POT family proton-dependent oligopeptide transporter